jgi:hypothetical protein
MDMSLMHVYVLTPWYVKMLYLLLLLCLFVVLPVLTRFFLNRRRLHRSSLPLPVPSPRLLGFVLILAIACLICIALSAASYAHEARTVREYANKHEGAPSLVAAFRRRVVRDGIVGGVALVLLSSCAATLVQARRSNVRAHVA